MNTIKLTVTALCAAVSLALQARTFNLTAWRGETLAARVPDSAEIGEAPDGISMRFGVLRSVRYTPSPASLELRECYDRVEWDSDAKGPRVVEVAVPADAKPGVYACGSIEVKVLDRVMPPPKDWKFYLDLWQHPWAVSRYEDVRPFSRAHYREMRKAWELLATAGQKTLTVSLLEEPWNHQCADAYHSMVGRVKKADGTWEFDYDLFDEYVEFGRSCGLGPEISCYTMCPWGYVVRWEDEEGRVQSAEAKPGTKAFDDFWGDFLVDFTKHLKAKGWFKDTLIAMDERSPEDVRYIADFIQKRSPGMRISMAGNRLPSEFKGITIDVYSQTLGYTTPELLAECAERRAKGFVTTHYVCCGPRYPNTFMMSAPGEAFWLGAYPAFSGYDGFLRWAWNSWPCDPCKDASYGDWLAGDTFLVYPDGEPSWRFLELRNGIVAFEKIRLLREKGLFAKELGELAKRYDHKTAIDNKVDFVRLRADTLSVVNRD